MAHAPKIDPFEPLRRLKTLCASVVSGRRSWHPDEHSHSLAIDHAAHQNLLAELENQTAVTLRFKALPPTHNNLEQVKLPIHQHITLT